jgi:hypothetical protein
MVSAQARCVSSRNVPIAAHATQPLMRSAELFEPEAEPIHAGVDLQPDCESLRRTALLEHRDLLERVNHELQVVSRCNVELAREEHAFEHDDRLRDARARNASASSSVPRRKHPRRQAPARP